MPRRWHASLAAFRASLRGLASRRSLLCLGAMIDVLLSVEPCHYHRKVDRDTVRTLASIAPGQQVCGVSGHHTGCLTAIDCATTDARCDADHPLLLVVASVKPGGVEPWRHVLGGTGSFGGSLDRNLKSSVIDPALFMMLPTAVLLYRHKEPGKADLFGCTATLCRWPQAQLACARTIAPSNVYPLPGETDSPLLKCGVPARTFTKKDVAAAARAAAPSRPKASALREAGTVWWEGARGRCTKRSALSNNVDRKSVV